MNKETLFYVNVQIVAIQLDEENTEHKQIVLKPEWHRKTFNSLADAQTMFNIATTGEQDILDNLS